MWHGRRTISSMSRSGVHMNPLSRVPLIAVVAVLSAGLSASLVRADGDGVPAKRNGVLAAAHMIVVNCGQFPSAAVAGEAEKQVNWDDADTADDTACTESFAALELQRCLRKMTGRADDFAVVKDDADSQGDLIVVGGPKSNAVSRRLTPQLGLDASKLAALGPEGYCIKSGTVAGRRVWLIAGASRVGTLYGVYDFLHRLGCRWFAPEAIHEELPHIEQIPAIDATERPSFISRGFYAWEDRGTPAFLVWMARNRLNYWTSVQTGHPLMRKLGIQMACGMHDVQQIFIGPNNPYPYRHSRFPGNQDKPADPYAVSPEYRGDANKDGKLSYFEAHPEWYAWDGKQRIPGINNDFGTNFCTSNADAATEFVKNYVQAIIDGRYRDTDVVNFWMLDWGKWCQCERCKTLGTPTDRNLLMVRRFDEEIKKAQAAGQIRHPILVTFLAYADVLDPPSRPLPAGFDYATCAATFYPIGRCYVHNFDDPACAMNQQYVRQLHGWGLEPARRYRGAITIGEYYNISTTKSLPVCYMHTMANDIPYYYKIGARHFDYMHVTKAEWGSKSLTNYQMARQLWDVGTDCESLWADYFARRYGPAAPMMRKYYESLEKMLGNVKVLKGWEGLAFRLNEGRKDLFQHSHLQYRREPGKKWDGVTLVEMVEHGKTCRALLTEAMAQPAPDRIKARLAEDERTFTYAERTLRYYDECVQAFQLAWAGHREEARPHYAEARRVADLLRSDTMSTRMASSHANDENALTATLAPKALDHLAKLLDTK
jgi:hypothetical protein